MDPDERKFAEFAQRQRRVEVFDSAGSAISAVVVACVAWLGQVPDVIRVLANAVRAWSVAKSVRRSEPIAQPGANPAVAAVAELERFGRRLSKILPPDARHRLYEPCIQDMLTEFRNSVDKDKRSGADKVKFIRRQLWWFKFKMALEVLICLRLAATDWIVGVMRRK